MANKKGSFAKKNTQTKRPGFRKGLGKIKEISPENLSNEADDSDHSLPPTQKYNSSGTRTRRHIVTADISSIMKEGIDNLHDEELDEFSDYPLHSTAVEVELFDKDVAPHQAKSTPPQTVSSPKKKVDKRKNLENKANNYKAKKSKKISEKANLKEPTVRKTSSKKPANMKTLAPSPALKSVRKSPKSKQLPNIDSGSEDEVLKHASGSGSHASNTSASLSSKSSLSTPAAGLPSEKKIEHQPSPSVSSNKTMTSSKKPANMKTLAPSSALKSVRKSPKSKQLPNNDPGSEDEELEHTSESGSQGSNTSASLSSKSSLSTPAPGLPSENKIEHQPSPSVSSNKTMKARKTSTNAKWSAIKSAQKTQKSKNIPSVSTSLQNKVIQTSRANVQQSKKKATLGLKRSSLTPAGLSSKPAGVNQSSRSRSSFGTMLNQPDESLEPSEQSEHLPNRKKRKTVHQTNDTTSPNLSTVQGNNVSLKIWCPDGTKRSTKDITELDIVLNDFSNIITSYKHKVESDVCLRTVDRFLTSLKKQLTDTIGEVQTLKVIQRKNTKIGAEINKKRKRLLAVNDELIVTRHQLKQLQKEYAQLEENKSSLKIAAQFLSDLEELQKEYMQYRKKAPKEKEEYGVSSLPALLLESRSILSAEKHLQVIGSKLQTFMDEERQQETQ